jgi:hypothetical protein
LDRFTGFDIVAVVVSSVVVSSLLLVLYCWMGDDYIAFVINPVVILS